MKKILLLIFSILFLASCGQYRYEVTYEKCNGSTGSYSYVGIDEIHTGKPGITTYKQAVPILLVDKEILNVCDFSYTKTPISDN